MPAKDSGSGRLLRLTNTRQSCDGLLLLDAIKPGTVPLVFFDPQHREVLDKQKYGNEGARQKGRATLPTMTPETIQKFIVAIESRLQPSGYLMLWVDKYLANECAWRHWFPDVSAFQSVDLMHWNKGRIGMGRRLRCQSEYLVILQKRPIRGKGTWSDHSLPDTWTEDSSRDRHPHAKPLQLLQRLIKATTKRGELVVDPAAGGFGVLDACIATGRTFLGCDLEG